MKKIIIFIGICLFLILIGLSIKNDWFRYRLLKEEFKRLSLQNENLTEEQEKLERLKESGSRQEVLEQEVRTILGLQKAGEHVVLVLPINDGDKNFSTTTLATSTNHFILLIAQINKFWYNLKDLFWHH
jgi:hypothetical protein